MRIGFSTLSQRRVLVLLGNTTRASIQNSTNKKQVLTELSEMTTTSHYDKFSDEYKWFFILDHAPIFSFSFIIRVS